jgi:hypothetical protein
LREEIAPIAALEPLSLVTEQSRAIRAKHTTPKQSERLLEILLHIYSMQL